MKNTYNKPAAERKALEILNQIRNQERELPVEEQQILLNRHIAGVNYVMQILEDVIVKTPRALQTSAYLLHEIDRQHYLEKIEEESLKVTMGEDPVALTAEAGVVVSRLNHHILERIEMALLISKELFQIEGLDEPAESLLE